jgi:hypothetical protein
VRGGMFVHSRAHGGRRVPFFGCMTYHQRGRAVCGNNLEVPLEAADQAVLVAVEHDLLRVEVLETALAKALDLLRPTVDSGEERGAQLRAELAGLDAEVTRLAAAIATGGELSALLAALQEREHRRGRIRAELASVARTAARDGLDMHGQLATLRDRLTDWQGLLRQEAPHTRRALSALLVGRLAFAAKGTGRERYYEITGQGTVRKVLAGLVLPTGVVSPTGFDTCCRAADPRRGVPAGRLTITPSPPLARRRAASVVR